jgi:hypothetical protein
MFFYATADSGLAAEEAARAKAKAAAGAAVPSGERRQAAAAQPKAARGRALQSVVRHCLGTD